MIWGFVSVVHYDGICSCETNHLGKVWVMSPTGSPRISTTDRSSSVLGRSVIAQSKQPSCRWEITLGIWEMGREELGFLKAAVLLTSWLAWFIAKLTKICCCEMVSLSGSLSFRWLLLAGTKWEVWHKPPFPEMFSFWKTWVALFFRGLFSQSWL